MCVWSCSTQVTNPSLPFRVLKCDILLSDLGEDNKGGEGEGEGGGEMGPIQSG